MKKPALLIMAAGLGSRYGGLKQMDSIGNNGEWIIDFSLYDAYTAGFRDVIFIVREEILHDFKETIGNRISSKMTAQYIVQSLTDLPEGYSLPPQRNKPWGTAHAIYSARELLRDRPFMAINADDFYGRKAFEETYNYLVSHDNNTFCMVSYLLKNTVTENGSVARGVCVVDANKLTAVTEYTNIVANGSHINYSTDTGSSWQPIDGDTPVSLNCWGFHRLMAEFEEEFPVFLDNAVPNNPLGAEFFLPTTISTLIDSGIVSVQVLNSHEKWYGITYKEDAPAVSTALEEMKDAGIYPFDLWA